jgi:hypothetical protein
MAGPGRGERSTVTSELREGPRWQERLADLGPALGLNYGEAGAMEYFGPELGLPPVLSAHNSYWLCPRRVQ